MTDIILSADNDLDRTCIVARQHTDARYLYSNSVRPSVTFRY